MNQFVLTICTEAKWHMGVEEREEECVLKTRSFACGWLRRKAGEENGAERRKQCPVYGDIVCREELDW